MQAKRFARSAERKPQDEAGEGGSVLFRQPHVSVSFLSGGRINTMKTKRVTRYIADCGKGFWNKKSCLSHEDNCKCWANQKYKTCKTCKYGNQYEDSNGMEHEPQYLHVWRQWECLNPAFDYDKHFTPAHEKAEDLCINCPVWVGK